jgi:DNA (cytosine-5)-methyltransferase 1
VRELSLFSGAGGGLLATRWLLGWRTVGYVEWDDYCQRVLAARIRDGLLDEAPIFGDVREFLESGAAQQYRGVADVVTGGFPCQPFSVAGKRLAARDDRNLWPETLATLREVGPRYALLENVPGLLSARHGYFGTVLGGLAEAGYDVRWCVLGAAEAGAPHLRKRLWIRAERRSLQGEVADARGDQVRVERKRGGEQRHEPGSPEPGDDGAQGPTVADPDRRRLEGVGQPQHRELQGAPGGGPDRCSAGRRRDGAWWLCDPAEDPESGVGRVAHGVAHRVDRLRALGNGQVPAVAALAWTLSGD